MAVDRLRSAEHGAIYVSTVLAIRVSERRTLAEMSSFDFVVAVAFGSIVGRTATAATPSYLQSTAALVALVVLHRLAGWLRLRSKAVGKAMDHPALVVIEDGRLVPEVLDQAHLTDVDVWRVLRENRVRTLDDVKLLVLEGSGRFSIFTHGDGPIDPRLLADLHPT